MINYKKIKSLFSKIFVKLNLIIAQSEKDKRNFVEIGAKFDKVHIDSSLKFDALEQNTLKPSFDFEEKLISQKKIITCASTHPQEEEILYESLSSHLKNQPGFACAYKYKLMPSGRSYGAIDYAEKIAGNEIKLNYYRGKLYDNAVSVPSLSVSTRVRVTSPTLKSN